MILHKDIFGVINLIYWRKIKVFKVFNGFNWKSLYGAGQYWDDIADFSRFLWIFKIGREAFSRDIIWWTFLGVLLELPLGETH